MEKELNKISSIRAYAEACKYMPGGVNSPVRAWNHLNISPLFIQKAKGPYLYDLDGNKFVDFCLSWGVSILGHANRHIIHATKKALKRGTSYGAPTTEETILAQLISRRIPSMEKIRLVSSGTEAVMTAIRLARAFTGKNIIIKFDGCYHGHSDTLLVNAGSGVTQLNQASSKGIPHETVQYTISLPFNNEEILTQFFEKKGYEVAAIILEIVPANMGVILPKISFLECIQQLATTYQCLIIADEIITGFRHPALTAQQYFAFPADITTLGKIVGGGFPIGVVGGKQEIMDLLAPSGPVYQAGTLSGNPIAVCAGISVLEQLSQPHLIKKIYDNSEYLYHQLNTLTQRYNFQFTRWGSMFSIFLTSSSIDNFYDVKNNIPDAVFTEFFKHMLHLKVYLSPSKYEANFISIYHQKKVLDEVLNKIEFTLKKIYNYAR